MQFHDVVRAAIDDVSRINPSDGRRGTEDSVPRSPSLIRGPLHESLPNTPSMRTGPPQSLGGYSLPNSPATSRNHPKFDPPDVLYPEERPVLRSEFRSALETSNSEQSDKKGKRRDVALRDENWTINPRKWFQEGQKTPASLGDDEGDNQFRYNSRSSAEAEQNFPTQSGLTKSQSVTKDGLSRTSASARWRRLRSMIPTIISNGRQKAFGTSVVASPTVNIADELLGGGLSTLMLRLWFERDEKGRRRIPVLLHRLRIRVSDSLHPLHGPKSVFRVECEYGNGVARWVIYRQLRDFISLHTHYTISRAYNRNTGALPEFPRTSKSLDQFDTVV
jgi:phospholipase D1/2